jgi:FixJ family two-component response regulator
VIGSRNSSNSNRLVDVARAADVPAHLIDDDTEIDLLLVIGSRNSSNSNRLVDVARAADVPAHLIDDDSAIRDSLSLWLGMRGIRCAAYDSAESFLAVVQPQWRGCVLIDLQLEGIDGLQLQAALAQRDITMPVIFVTGHGDVGAARDALKAGALAYLSVPLIDRLTLRWFMSDLDQRSQAIAATMAEPLREAQQRGALARVTSLLNAAATDERLQSAALCDARGEVVARSAQFPDSVGCAPAAAGGERVLRLLQGVLHPTRVPLRLGEGPEVTHTMLVLHDMSFIELRSSETRWYAMATFGVLALVASLITVAVAHLSWRGWVRGARAMLTGEGLLRPFAEGPATVDKALLPLEAEVRSLFRRLERQRAADTGAAEGWSAQRLRAVLQMGAGQLEIPEA